MDFNRIISKLPPKLQSLGGKRGHAKSTDSQEKKKPSASNLLIFRTLFNALGKYSYNHENILGVEISPHYIRVCQMKNSYGSWHLNHLASSCMESQFTNADIQMNVDLYAETLRLLIEKHRIKTKDIALSVPTSSSVIKIINMPDMDEEDLAQAASMGAIWESMVQLQGGIHDYSVYYKVLQRKVKPSMSLTATDNSYLETNYLDSTLSGSEENYNSDTSVSELNLDNLLSGETTQPENDTYIEGTIANEENLVTVENTEIPGDISTELTTETNSFIDSPSFSESIEEVVAEPEPEEDTNTMDVLFVASRLNEMQLYVDIAQKAGLKTLVVDVKCNAIKRAFEINPEKHNITQPYALLEFGPDENYIYIIEDQNLVTFNIEISDEDKQLMLNYKESEEALNDLIQRYAGQLEQILETYTQQHKRKLRVYNIYVNSATPLHVDDAASEPIINIFISKLSEILISYKFSSSTFCNHIEVPSEFAKKVNAEGNLSAWSTVLGLATCKLDAFDCKKDTDAINKVNLFPGSIFIKKNQVTKVLSTLAMAAVFSFVAFISGASFLVLNASGSQLVNEIKSLESVKGDYAVKNENLQKLTLTMEKIKSLDGVKSSLPSNQSQILLAYKELTKAIPEGVWLNEINFKPPSSMDIKGNSINDQKILEFVNNLNNSGGFKKISLKTMEAIEKTEKDKTATAGAASSVKKFMLQGDFLDSAGLNKLDLISSGVK